MRAWSRWRTAAWRRTGGLGAGWGGDPGRGWVRNGERGFGRGGGGGGRCGSGNGTNTGNTASFDGIERLRASFKFFKEVTHAPPSLHFGCGAILRGILGPRRGESHRPRGRQARKALVRR